MLAEIFAYFFYRLQVWGLGADVKRVSIGHTPFHILEAYSFHWEIWVGNGEVGIFFVEVG